MCRHSLFCTGLLVGLAIGCLVTKRSTTPPAPPTPAEEPTEVSVMWPDPAEPTGFSGRRFRVSRSGDNAAGPGAPGRDEWVVTMWYGDQYPGETRRYASHLGPPVAPPCRTAP